MDQRVYVVEDLAISRAAIINTLETNNYIITGSSALADEAWMELKTLKIDLVLIDINLPGKLDGIWLANKIREKLNVAIIFITAFGDKETIQKINELEPEGYIMKPYNAPTLLSSIKIALQHFNLKQTALTRAENEQFIFIKHNGIKTKLITDQILYIQSEKNYLLIVLKNKQYRTRLTLGTFVDELNCTSFIRVHRSYVVNSNHIKSKSVNSIIINETEIPISDSYKPELKDF